MVKGWIASVALAFTRRGCYGWWGACLTDRAMTCVHWYVCSFCGKPWRFCDTLPPLHAYCLHLVPYNSVTRVRCQLEMPLPIVIFNFLICRWLLSRFLVMSELTPLSNVLLSNWVSGAQGKPDLRVWCSMDPAVSRAQALRLEESCYFLWMISVWYVLGQWNTTTMMLCLWSMWFFFGP